MFFHCLSDQ